MEEVKTLNQRLEKPQREERILGIDLLKILSMFMVVVLHINGHGGIIWNPQCERFTDNWYFSVSLEHVCIVAVNAFAMISGYVYFGRKWKIKNLLSLWLQVFFYSVIITVIFMIAKGTDIVTWEDFWNACRPVITKQYWYFSVYFLLFLAMPMLNLAIERFEKLPTMLVLAVVGFMLTVANSVVNAFAVGDGYNLIWLTYLYAVGAFVKKYDFTFRIGKKKFGAWAFAGLYLLCVIAAVTRGAIMYSYGDKGHEYGYTFALNFLASVALFLCFTRIKRKSNKAVTLIAAAAFGVYIISEQPLLRRYCITDQFQKLLEYNPFAMLGLILLYSLIIYVACTGIEILRQYLFKLARVPKFTAWVQKRVDRAFTKKEKTGEPVSNIEK